MKIACIQMNSQSDVQQNLEMMHAWIQKCASADCIFFPEVCEYCGKDLKGNASDIQEIYALFSDWAKKYDVYLYIGSITEKCEGRPRNTSLFIGPQGDLLGQYSKVHLFDMELEDQSFRESASIEAGNAYSVVPTKMATFGMSICYDLRFADMYQKMAQAGAEILVVAANFTKETGQAHWEALLRARAIENTSYVIAINQTGRKDELSMEAYGHTMVIDPWGRILAQAEGDAEQCVWATLSLEDVYRVRQSIPCLSHARPNVGVWVFPKEK